MRRLHPVSPAFLLVKLAWQMVYPLLGAFAWSSFQSQWLLYGLLGLIPIGALWQYVFFRFALEDEQLLIAEGLLFRKNRKIPYARVQNINTIQNPAHRLLGVATVQLESASGGKPEAVLRVVDLATVERLRQLVQAAHGVGTAAENGMTSNQAAASGSTMEDEHTAGRTVLVMPLIDVLRYGLASQKGMLVFALLSGFFSQNPRWYQQFGSWLADMGWVPHWSEWSRAQLWLMGVGVALMVLVLLQVFTMAWAILRLYDFRLLHKPGRLFASMGLLSRSTVTIPLARVQLFRIMENPIHQWLGGATVTVETAGGVNNEQQGLVMRWLAPYVSRGSVIPLLETVEPGADWQTLDWKPLPQRAWLRLFKRHLLAWWLSAGLLGYLLYRWQLLGSWWPLAILFLIGIPVLAWHARAWVRQAGYAVSASRISACSGVLFRQQVHVKMDKVQVMTIHQSPFDRRHGMASLRIDTAGSNPLMSPLQVRYLPVAEAVRIRDFVLAQLRRQTSTDCKNALQSRHD